MLIDSWKKFIKSVRFFFPIILINYLMECAYIYTDKLFPITRVTGVVTSNKNFIERVNKQNLLMCIIISIIFILISAFIEVYILLIIKESINNNKIDYKSQFKKSFSYYPRYIVLGIIMLFITLGLTLISFVLGFNLPFLIIIGILLVLFLSIIMTPCGPYLVYVNSSVDDGLYKGMSIGKKYFWSILLLIILRGAVYIDIKIEFIDYIQSLIVAFINTYIFLFSMNICKKELESHID